MKLSLLLDLDNTLLANDMMGTFLPVYLQALSRKFPQVSGEAFVKKLLFATQAMITKNQPALTLEQAFDQVFYPLLGISKDAALPILNQFYETDFARLNYLAQARPEAASLVRRGLDAGWQVVIATNPIFPRRAIEHRLNWAGLSPDWPFALVTSYEKFHFAKPNPAYYAEILAQLGNPEQPAVMVGDSLSDDLVPAARLGIPGFLVTDHPQDIPASLGVSIQQGPLDQVWGWLQQLSGELPPPPPPLTTTAPSILATLNAAPAALETLCLDLPPAQWTYRIPNTKEWAITEVVCHMRDVDREVNAPRIPILKQENNPFLPGIDSDIWVEERKYIEQSGQDALAALVQSRSEWIAQANLFSATDWARPVRHAIFGPTTPLELFGFAAAHDKVHVRQVFKMIHAPMLS